MIERRQDVARLQSDFYRDQFRRTLRWLIITVAITFLLIAAIIYLILFHPLQPFYANTTEGKILSMPRQV